MTRNRHKESLPKTDDYLDIKGDVRHVDDDPEGFEASGRSPYGDFFRGDATPHKDTYYEELAEEDRLPVVAVDLGFRATNLLLATDSLAHASMLQGFLNSRNRQEIAKHGGELAIRKKIKNETARGRQALRAAYGIDAMLANPQMIPNEYGFPYSPEDAHDEEVQLLHAFRQKYTAEAVRSMPADTPIVEKIAKKKETDAARHDLRHNLARQVRVAKEQWQ